MTCESLTKIIKNHQNSLKRLLLDRSRRGEAGGPNESSRGLGLARLLTSPQLLENCQFGKLSFFSWMARAADLLRIPIKKRSTLQL